MTRRRLWGVPGLTGIALLLAVPFVPPAAAGAESAPQLTVSITSPGAGQKLTSSNAVDVSGQVNAGLAAVDAVDVSFTYGGTAVGTVRACEPCKGGPTVAFSTTSPALALNGSYGIQVSVVGHLLLNGVLPVEGSASSSFVLAVPPDPPTGVTATVLGDRKVKLAWTAPAKPPDFLGYVIYRKIDAGAFSFLGTTTQTTFTDDKTTQLAGPIQYQVASVRAGATLDSADALQTPAAAVVATLPALPTTSTTPGETTTSTTPGGGKQAGGAADVDLSGLLPANPIPVPTFPSPTPVTLPDTGYSETLPFPTLPPTTAGKGTPVEGRQLGNAGNASGEGQLRSSGANTNRRALLIPVAAGSVLCVTALHLRWLNRRLAVSAALDAVGRTGPPAPPGPSGPPGPPRPRSVVVRRPGDLQPLPPDPTVFKPDAKPVRVGAAPR